jgi:hypothetical protein
MALFPTYQQSIFALDPAAGLNASNQWKDSGPYQLDVSPQGYAAPAYGISDGPSGAKRITFNGANQYGNIPSALYTYAPTTVATVAVVLRHNAPAAVDRILSLRSDGPFRGLELYCSTAERLALEGADGATTSGDRAAADIPLTGRTRVHIVTAQSGLVGSGLGLWNDRVQVATTHVGVAGAVWSYGPTIPKIGTYAPVPSAYFDGDLYFLGIWNFVWTDSEAKAFSDYWLNRT